MIINQRAGHGQREYLERALAARVDFGRFPVVTVGPSRFSCVRDSPVGMMQETLERTLAAGYRRIAVVMDRTDQQGDDNARLGAVLLCRERLPPGAKLEWRHEDLNDKNRFDGILNWLRAHRPDAIVGFPGGVYWQLRMSGFAFPRDGGFAGVVVPEGITPGEDLVAGVRTDHAEYNATAIQMMDQLLRLGLRGLPEHPLVRVLPLQWRDGATLPERVPPPAAQARL